MGTQVCLAGGGDSGPRSWDGDSFFDVFCCNIVVEENMDVGLKKILFDEIGDIFPWPVSGEEPVKRAKTDDVEDGTK